jgi:hypothetical protein
MIRLRHTARVSRTQRDQRVFRRSRIGWRIGCALAVLLASGGWAFAADVVTVLNPTHDTYVGTRPSAPRGNSARLVVSRRYTAMLKFDLSQVPTSAIVREAKLRLFVLGYKRGAGPPRSPPTTSRVDGTSTPPRRSTDLP